MKAKESGKKSYEKKSTGKFFCGIGRRKLATAKVLVFPGKIEDKSDPEISINKKSHKDYFSLAELREIVTAPLKTASDADISKILVSVQGGGIRGQAEAIRLGIARALVLFNEDFRKPLRSAGYLTRNARVVERKKAGLKKARRAPQFSKR